MLQTIHQKKWVKGNSVALLYNSSPPFSFVISFGTFINGFYLGMVRKVTLLLSILCLWSNHSLQKLLTSGLHDLTRFLRWKWPHSMPKNKSMNYCALNRKKRVCAGIYVQLCRTNVIQNCGTGFRISYGTWEKINSRFCFCTSKHEKYSRWAFLKKNKSIFLSR